VKNKIPVEPGVRVATRQLAKCELNSGLAKKNANPLASLAKFFFPLTDHFYNFGQLFSALASENSELLASLASVLKKLIPTPVSSINVMNYICNEKAKWSFL
jgi:hypothetical protein